MDTEEFMKNANVDLIVQEGVEHFDVEDTPALRELLGKAYDIGGMENAVTPLAPGDPAAAERDCREMAVALTLMLKHPDNPGGPAAAEQVLSAYYRRMGD